MFSRFRSHYKNKYLLVTTILRVNAIHSATPSSVGKKKTEVVIKITRHNPARRWQTKKVSRNHQFLPTIKSLCRYFPISHQSCRRITTRKDLWMPVTHVLKKLNCSSRCRLPGLWSRQRTKSRLVFLLLRQTSRLRQRRMTLTSPGALFQVKHSYGHR